MVCVIGVCVGRGGGLIKVNIGCVRAKGEGEPPPPKKNKKTQIENYNWTHKRVFKLRGLMEPQSVDEDRSSSYL